MSENIKKRNPLLKSNQENVDISRDMFLGNVINDTYLPKFSSETDQSHQDRIMQVAPINDYNKAIIAISGIVTEKNYSDESGLVGEKFDLENVNKDGDNLEVFVKNALKESLIDGVSFVGLEIGDDFEELRLLRYSDLWNFRYVDGNLVYAVFRENEYADTQDYSLVKTERFVEYELREGTYNRRVYFNGAGSDGKSKEFAEDKDQAKSIKYSRDRLPIFPIITGNVAEELVVSPSFLDLAKTNISLIIKSSLLSYSAFLTMSPSLKFVGGYAGDIQEEVSVDADGNATSQKKISYGERKCLFFR